MFGFPHASVLQGGDGVNPRPDGRTVHLALYKYDSCPFCRRVMRGLDGLDVNLELRDVLADPKWRHDLFERTGRTQVPCLLIDDEPMFESDDILRWLRQNFSR